MIGKQKQRKLRNKVWSGSAVLAATVLLAVQCRGYTATSDGIDSASELSVAAPADTVPINVLESGQKEGLWKTYHSNGKLKTEGMYRAGLKEGLHSEWAADGIPLWKGYYMADVSHGLMTWYHEQGHIAGQGEMVKGVRQGLWKICDIEENGFCIDAYFTDGRRDGVWKIYHTKAQEKVWKEQTFKDDRLVEEKCYDLNGVVIKCQAPE